MPVSRRVLPDSRGKLLRPRRTLRSRPFPHGDGSPYGDRPPYGGPSDRDCSSYGGGYLFGDCSSYSGGYFYGGGRPLPDYHDHNLSAGTQSCDIRIA